MSWLVGLPHPSISYNKPPPTQAIYSTTNWIPCLLYTLTKTAGNDPGWTWYVPLRWECASSKSMACMGRITGTLCALLLSAASIAHCTRIVTAWHAMLIYLVVDTFTWSDNFGRLRHLSLRQVIQIFAHSTLLMSSNSRKVAEYHVPDISVVDRGLRSQRDRRFRGLVSLSKTGEWMISLTRGDAVQTRTFGFSIPVLRLRALFALNSLGPSDQSSGPYAAHLSDMRVYSVLRTLILLVIDYLHAVTI